MRRVLILPVTATLALGACGGNSDNPVEVSFPPVHVQGGRAYASVKDQPAAARYCIQALGSWPDAYSAYDKVTFKFPGPGGTYVCKRSE